MSAGAGEWNVMSAVQKAPWKRLGDESARHYHQQKATQDARQVHYFLSDAELQAAAKRKKRAVATARAAAAAGASTSAKTSASAGKKAKVPAKTVKKSTTGVKVPARKTACL